MCHDSVNWAKLTQVMEDLNTQKTKNPEVKVDGGAKRKAKNYCKLLVPKYVNKNRERILE